MGNCGQAKNCLFSKCVQNFHFMLKVNLVDPEISSRFLIEYKPTCVLRVLFSSLLKMKDIYGNCISGLVP